MILDEADMLESEMLGHVEVNISNRSMARMSIDPPQRKTVESSWRKWVELEAIPKVRAYLGTLPPSGMGSLEQTRERDKVNELLSRLRVLAAELARPNPGWIYDGYDDGHAIFRPIRVGKFGNELLWPHANKFLLMSATVLSADLMADELGYTGRYELVDVPSNFPVENRKIHVVPFANMAWKNREQAWPRMVVGVAGVIHRHPGERVLVHTVSYELARYLNANLPAHTDRPLFTYLDSRGKADALAAYKDKPDSVLLAPSMDRGIDLPDDLCRVQVVAKIPYPNVKDRRISARMHASGGRGWYALQTIRTLIQMTGRGVRSKDDHATTYILDEQFTSNLRKNDYLFPKWWSDALNYRFSPRKLEGIHTHLRNNGNNSTSNNNNKGR
jgi:Rad3-related DNA helicase